MRRLMLQMRSRSMLGPLLVLLVLAGGGWAQGGATQGADSSSLPSVAGLSVQAAQAAQVHMDAGEFGVAMAEAKRIAPEPKRARMEALILYRARSYDAALDRALFAIDGGEGDETLLSIAVNAAVWILDTDSALYCIELLEQRLAEMAPADHEAWAPYVKDLAENWVADLKRKDASTSAAVQRSRNTAFGILGMVLLGLVVMRQTAR